MAGELGAVGGEGQLVQSLLGPIPQPPAESLDQPDHVPPDQRLAASPQADLRHAEADEGPAEALQLLEREDLRLR